MRYGLAYALFRAKKYPQAEQELEIVRRQKSGSAMAEDLAGEIKAAAGDLTAASNIFREALQRFPLSRALAYGYADTLFSQRSYDRLQVFLDEQLQLYPVRSEALWAAGQNACGSGAKAAAASCLGRDVHSAGAPRSAMSSFSSHSALATGISMNNRWWMPVCAS